MSEPLAVDTASSQVDDRLLRLVPPQADSSLRRRLIAAGLASLALSVLRLWLGGISLPFDPEFAAVVGLMWPTSGLGIGAVGIAFRTLDLVCFSLPVVLAIGVLLAARRGRVPPMVQLAYRSALVAPLLAFVATGLSRWVSNGLYEAASLVSADYSPILVSLEGHPLERLQQLLASDVVSHACGIVYSSGWLIALVLAVPLCAAFVNARAVNHLLAGWMLAPVVAMPFFLLLPVYEPWVFNPLYGYAGPDPTTVRLLTGNTPLIDLAGIAAQTHWATGACLPSLHVALPAFVSRVAYQGGNRWLGRVYAAIAGLIGFVVVYLGRHWVADVILAVPFAVGVAWLARRLNPSLVLSWPPAQRPG